VTEISVTESETAISIEECSPSSLTCKKIKVLTNKAYPSGGSELDYSAVVKTVGAEQTFSGKIQIDCSAQVQITTASTLSTQSRYFT